MNSRDSYKIALYFGPICTGNKEELIKIRRLTEKDSPSLGELRLHALATDPASFAEAAEAFGKTTVEI
jgi:hypothetical protein